MLWVGWLLLLLWTWPMMIAHPWDRKEYFSCSQFLGSFSDILHLLWFFNLLHQNMFFFNACHDLSQTEQLNKHKTQQKVGSSSEKTQKESDHSPEAEKADEVATDGPNPGTSKQQDLLPTMRRERAASVAKRRQRPVTTDYGESCKRIRLKFNRIDTGAVPVIANLHR